MTFRKYARQDDFVSRVAIEIIDLCNRFISMLEALESAQATAARENRARRIREQEAAKSPQERTRDYRPRDEGAYRAARSQEQNFKGQPRRTPTFK